MEPLTWVRGLFERLIRESPGFVSTFRRFDDSTDDPAVLREHLEIIARDTSLRAQTLGGGAWGESESRGITLHASLCCQCLSRHPREAEARFMLFATFCHEVAHTKLYAFRYGEPDAWNASAPPGSVPFARMLFDAGYIWEAGAFGGAVVGTRRFTTEDEFVVEKVTLRGVDLTRSEEEPPYEIKLDGRVEVSEHKDIELVVKLCNMSSSSQEILLPQDDLADNSGPLAVLVHVNSSKSMYSIPPYASYEKKYRLHEHFKVPRDYSSLLLRVFYYTAERIVLLNASDVGTVPFG
eukprot:m51a1_g11582 hypothetical protein (294) ;mRNA; r:54205-55411